MGEPEHLHRAAQSRAGASDISRRPARRRPSASAALAAEKSLAVEGLVESGLSLGQRRRAELAALDLRLADDFVIVDRGERPRPLWFATGELVLGLSALSLLVRRIRRWFRGDRAPLPRATLARERAADGSAGSA